MKNSYKNIFDIKKKIIIITGGAGFLGSEFSIAVSNVGAIPIILDKNQISINFLKNFSLLNYLTSVYNYF